MFVTSINGFEECDMTDSSVVEAVRVGMSQTTLH